MTAKKIRDARMAKKHLQEFLVESERWSEALEFHFVREDRFLGLFLRGWVFASRYNEYRVSRGWSIDFLTEDEEEKHPAFRQIK